MSGVRNVTQSTPRVPTQESSPAPAARPAGGSGNGGGSRVRPDNFVDRPKGLAPSDPRLDVQPNRILPPSSQNLFGARAEAEPVVINKSVAPNAPVQDLQTTESKLQIDEDVPVEKLK